MTCWVWMPRRIRVLNQAYLARIVWPEWHCNWVRSDENVQGWGLLGSDDLAGRRRDLGAGGGVEDWQEVAHTPSRRWQVQEPATNSTQPLVNTIMRIAMFTVYHSFHCWAGQLLGIVNNVGVKKKLTFSFEKPITNGINCTG